MTPSSTAPWRSGPSATACSAGTRVSLGQAGGARPGTGRTAVERAAMWFVLSSLPQCFGPLTHHPSLPLASHHRCRHRCRRLPAEEGAGVRCAAQALPGERRAGAGHAVGPAPRVPHPHGAPALLLARVPRRVASREASPSCCRACSGGCTRLRGPGLLHALAARVRLKSSCAAAGTASEQVADGAVPC